MNACIKYTSYYLPEHKLTNEKLAELFPEWSAGEIFEKTGIRERGISPLTELSSDKAVKAAEKLFAEYPIDKSEIDFLLFCTQTPDHITPSTSCIIQDRLGLRKSIGALDVNQGCTGFVYCLSLAKGLIETGMAKNVLLLVSESITRMVHPADKSARLLFGDAGSATIISARAEEGIGSFVFGTNGSGKDMMIIKAGAFRQPYLKNGSYPEQKDEYGNVCSDEHFRMDGAGVLTFSIEVAEKMVKELLATTTQAANEIDYYIFHQANGFVLKVIQRKLKIPDNKFCINLADTGNTGPCTIPIALRDCLDDGRIKKGDRVMLVAFGVGLSWTATTVII